MPSLKLHIYLYTYIVRDYTPPELCSLSILCVVGFVVFLLFCAGLSIVVAVCLRVCYLFVRSIHWDCFEKEKKTIGFSKINKCTKCHTDKRRNVVTPYKMHWKKEMKQKTMPAPTNEQTNVPKNKTLFTGYKNLSLLLSLDFFFFCSYFECMRLEFTHRLKFLVKEWVFVWIMYIFIPQR